MSKTIELRNLSSHMRGKVVLTNGTKYAIDEKGIAKNVTPEDAKKMLAGADWRLVKASDSKKVASIPDGANEKMRSMLEDAEAEIERLEDRLEKSMDEIERLQGELEKHLVGGQDFEAEIERLQGELEKHLVDGGQDSPLLSDDGQPITDVAGDSPEPNESMDIDELKAMADKLSVSYGPKIGSSLLVERIKEAMAPAA